MAERVFVKVVGFSDVERHALNTVFRLSQLRPTVYQLWLPDAPDAPLIELIDGESEESRLEHESPGGNDEAIKLIWIGPDPPARAWRVFERPLAWAQVVRAMDGLFAPIDPLDYDLGLYSDSETEAEAPPGRRALIVAADRDERLYLRARLALAGLTHADEAATAAEAFELLRGSPYVVALVDFELPDADGWAFIKQLARGDPSVPRVYVTKPRPTLVERLRARMAGARLFDKPPDPGRLQAMLQKV